VKKSSTLLFVVSLLGFAVLKLWLAGSLLNYIHPSTLWMVSLAACVLLLITGLWLVQRPDHFHVTSAQVGTLLLIAVILFLTKVAPLSTSLAKDRDTGGTPVTSRKGISITGQTANFTVLEWLAAWDSDPTHLKYAGAQAKVIGFVTIKNDTYFVNRLLITCCVVDAQPIEVEFNSLAPIAEGQWVEIQGRMADKAGKPYIKTEKVNQIDAPNEQYLY
jgi:putative membrane protein